MQRFMEPDDELLGSLSMMWSELKSAAYTMEDELPLGYLTLDAAIGGEACPGIKGAWRAIVRAYLDVFPQGGKALLAHLRLQSGAWPDRHYGIPEEKI